MAFTRKFLTALGIESEKVDEIIGAHVEVTDSIKAERDQYKADAERLPKVQKELDDLKEAAKKDGGENPFEKKYNDLKAEFETFKTEQAAMETKRAKEAAYRNVLKEAGISDKRLDAVLRVTDLEKVELDKDGKLKDAESVVKSVKEEWSDFIITTTEKGANTANPPANTGGKTITKQEIMAIKDGAERRKAMAENPELFDLVPKQ